MWNVEDLMDLENWNLKWTISRWTPNSPYQPGALLWGRGINCLVVFPTHFNPRNSLLILLQISLVFMCNPALKCTYPQNKFFAQINLCTCLKHTAPFCPVLKVTKSGHYLLHDRASKGYGSIPGWTSQTDLHRIKSCIQISLWRPPRNRPIPLTCSVVQQMMARFRNFYSL